MLQDYLFHSIYPNPPSSARYQGDWCTQGKHRISCRENPQPIILHISFPTDTTLSYFWKQTQFTMYTVTSCWNTNRTKLEIRIRITFTLANIPVECIGSGNDMDETAGFQVDNNCNNNNKNNIEQESLCAQ